MYKDKWYVNKDKLVGFKIYYQSLLVGYCENLYGSIKKFLNS